MITLPENPVSVEIKWTSYGRGWEAKVMVRVGHDGGFAHGWVSDAACAETAFATAIERMEADRDRILARLDYATAEFAPHFPAPANA